MPNPHKSRISISTKIGLAIVVVVAIVAFFYYRPESNPLNNFNFNKVTSGFTNIFGGATGGERLYFVMTSSESLLTQGTNLEGATIAAKGQQLSQTVFGDSAFDNLGKNSEVSFEDFNGQIQVSGKTLSVDGSASSASSDGTKVRPKGKRFTVNAKLVPESYSISPVNLDKIFLTNIYGSVERLGEENSTIKLTNSSVEITGFQGSVTFDGIKYKISGSATEFKGKSFTLKG